MDIKTYVYCLYSDSHDKIYIGQTNNIEKRLTQHNAGKVKSTKAYVPYRLIYIEDFKTKKEAINREKELKLTQGRRFLRTLLN